MTVASRLLDSAPSYTSYLTTEVNSLADGAGVLGNDINNSSRLPFVVWRLNLASLTPTAGGYIELYSMPGDGTNYAEGDATNLPRPDYLIWTWSLRAGSGARYLWTKLIPVMWRQKVLIYNKAGAAFAGSGTVLSYALVKETYETP